MTVAVYIIAIVPEEWECMLNNNLPKVRRTVLLEITHFIFIFNAEGTSLIYELKLLASNFMFLLRV